MATHDYDFKASLIVNGVTVPVSSFDLQFAEGALGASVAFELADPIADPPEGNAQFQMSVDGDTINIIDSGRVSQKDKAYEWLGDNRTARVISKLAERIDLSPATPIVLFDAFQLETTPLAENSLGELVDSNHVPILTTYQQVTGLDLLQLLSFVYVDKLGFAGVVTNIANFLIPRVDFPISRGWHEAAAAELALFEPQYHADDHGTLYIVDPQAQLPPGTTARQVGVSRYSSLSVSKDLAKLINQVVMSYRDNQGAGPVTARVIQPPPLEVGTPGSINWQRTAQTEHLVDHHDNPFNPLEITRTDTVGITTVTSAVADGLTRAVQIDDQQDVYQYDFRLKTGYVKTLSIYCAVPGDSTKEMRQVQTEVQQITYRNLGGVAGEFIKVSEVVDVTGSVLNIPDDPGDPDGSGVRQSLYDANRQDAITDDMVLEQARAISTTITQYREVGPDQVEVSEQRIDHLSSQASPGAARTVTHTGTIRVRMGSRQVTANMLLVLPGTLESERRPPRTLGAGNVPFAAARPVALRILNRRGVAPKRVECQLPGLDLSLRRGSVRTAVERDGGTHEVFVTGYRIVGRQLGTAQSSVQMSFSAVEVGPQT